MSFKYRLSDTVSSVYLHIAFLSQIIFPAIKDPDSNVYLLNGNSRVKAYSETFTRNGITFIYSGSRGGPPETLKSFSRLSKNLILEVLTFCLHLYCKLKVHFVGMILKYFGITQHSIAIGNCKFCSNNVMKRFRFYRLMTCLHFPSSVAIKFLIHKSISGK